jgi:hypothetical protein
VITAQGVYHCGDSLGHAHVLDKPEKNLSRRNGLAYFCRIVGGKKKEREKKSFSTSTPAPPSSTLWQIKAVKVLVVVDEREREKKNCF